MARGLGSVTSTSIFSNAGKTNPTTKEPSGSTLGKYWWIFVLIFAVIIAYVYMMDDDYQVFFPLNGKK